MAMVTRAARVAERADDDEACVRRELLPLLLW